MLLSQTEQSYSLWAVGWALNLRLTAIRSPGLPFNGHHPRSLLIYPEEWKAELALLVDP